MGRLPILLLLLGVAALVNPTVRAKAEPYAKPHVEKALSPFYAWSVKHRLGEISRGLQERVSRGQKVPPQSEFSLFLQQYYRDGTAHLDPWGVPFFLRPDRGGVRVLSAGRDGVANTADDVSSPRIAL